MATRSENTSSGSRRQEHPDNNRFVTREENPSNVKGDITNNVETLISSIANQNASLKMHGSSTSVGHSLDTPHFGPLSQPLVSSSTHDAPSQTGVKRLASPAPDQSSASLAHSSDQQTGGCTDRGVTSGSGLNVENGSEIQVGSSNQIFHIINIYTNCHEDQTGLDRRSNKHEDQTGLDRQGDQHEDQTGLDRQGSQHEDQTGLDRQGSQHEDQTGLDRQGSQHEDQTGLDRQGSRNLEEMSPTNINTDSLFRHENSRDNKRQRNCPGNQNNLRKLNPPEMKQTKPVKTDHQTTVKTVVTDRTYAQIRVSVRRVLISIMLTVLATAATHLLTSTIPRNLLGKQITSTTPHPGNETTNRMHVNKSITPKKESENLTILDSRGQELVFGDLLEITSPEWTYAIYIGDGNIIRRKMKNLVVVKEDIELLKWFGKCVLTSVGLCREYSPSDRVARAVSVIGQRHLVEMDSKNRADFAVWAYTGHGLKQAYLRGFRMKCPGL